MRDQSTQTLGRTVISLDSLLNKIKITLYVTTDKTLILKPMHEAMQPSSSAFLVMGY